MTVHPAAEVMELAPEPPPRGPLLWLRENLFSTPASSVMSLVALAVVLFAYRGILGFVFGEGRRWEAVTFNIKLLMVQAFPAEQMVRIWVSVGIVVVLLAATLAVYRIGGRVAPRRIGGILLGVGPAVLLGGILGPFGTAGRLEWGIVGVVLAAAGYLVRTVPGPERAKEETIPILGVVGSLVGLLLVVIWTVPLPVPLKDDTGEQFVGFARIARSTALPWTILAVVGTATYFLFRALGDRIPAGATRRVLVGLWVLSYPVIVLVVLRDPHLDYHRVLTWYTPLALGFTVVGGIVLQLVASDREGELARVAGGILLVVALASLLFAKLPMVPFDFPMEWVVRLLLLLLAVFALAAPTFGGKGQGRLRFLALWAVLTVVVVFLSMVVTAESTVEVPGNFFIGGLGLTLIISISAIVASFPLGVLLALGRTSSMPIFRIMSTVYIELIRGVPLITWLLVAFIMLPVALPHGVEIQGVMRAVGAMTFFSAAYLAENVRGGLQALPKGQYEASRALGMTTAQMTIFIVLPQALRAVIPALVGQIISIFKDTSLVTIVGLFDFLHIARVVIPGQSQPFNFLGALREPLLFAAAVYWMFTFTFSRISLRLEKKLGVGER